jgi:hypothetical protein
MIDGRVEPAWRIGAGKRSGTEAGAMPADAYTL